jgi:hypothetical protein
LDAILSLFKYKQTPSSEKTFSHWGLLLERKRSRAQPSKLRLGLRPRSSGSSDPRVYHVHKGDNNNANYEQFTFIESSSLVEKVFIGNLSMTHDQFDTLCDLYTLNKYPKSRLDANNCQNWCKGVLDELATKLNNNNYDGFATSSELHRHDTSFARTSSSVREDDHIQPTNQQYSCLYMIGLTSLSSESMRK